MGSEQNLSFLSLGARVSQWERPRESLLLPGTQGRERGRSTGPEVDAAVQRGLRWTRVFAELPAKEWKPPRFLRCLDPCGSVLGTDKGKMLPSRSLVLRLVIGLETPCFGGVSRSLHRRPAALGSTAVRSQPGLGGAAPVGTLGYPSSISVPPKPSWPCGERLRVNASDSWEESDAETEFAKPCTPATSVFTTSLRRWF